MNPRPTRPAATGRAGPAADVGRWFSTASRAPDGPGPTRGGPRLPAWGPMEGAHYGRRSAPEEIASALDLLRGRPVAVLTGAGVSTGSGLPDYRGRDAVPRSPMTYQEFMGHDLARRRYWARSTVGWEQFRRARPGAAHRLLAALSPGVFETTAVITQNVDGLHSAAGSQPVIDLHGRLDRVRCQQCEASSARQALHQRMLSMNPSLAARLPELAADAAQAPDGDAEVDRTSSFRYPPCGLCGGILKPDVVFFGESAHRDVVAAAFAALEAAEALLVLGSSLTIQSGLRFARAARRQDMPVVIVNDGPTRADAEAALRVHGRLEDVLADWAAIVGVQDPGVPPQRAGEVR